MGGPVRILIEQKSFDLGVEDGRTGIQYRKLTGIADNLSYWSGYIEGAAVAGKGKNANEGSMTRKEPL